MNVRAKLFTMTSKAAKSLKHTNKLACNSLPNTAVGPNLKLAKKFPRTRFFLNTSLTFGQFPDIPLTAIKLQAFQTSGPPAGSLL